MKKTPPASQRRLGSSRWIACISALILFGFTPFLSFASLTLQVHEHVLKNGLRILMHEDHTAPIISYYSFVNVGSAHEKTKQTGIAHLFEHMMFLGTQKYGKKEYDAILAAHGGINNAGTSHDYTDYYVNIPSSNLELVMELESDRLVNLNLTQENLNSEREVVKEERRLRVDNNPMGKMYITLFELAFPDHPYYWPTIGYMKDLNALTVQECQKFYKTYYSTNNTVVVLAGDFDADKALTLFKKYYENLPPQNIPKLEAPAIPVQTKERVKVLKEPTQSDVMMMAYPTPAAGHPDMYALDILSKILSSGKTSRLFKKLIYEEQVASSAWASYYGLKQAGLFIFMVRMKPGFKIKKGEEHLFDEIQKIKREKVIDRELTKAKNQILSDFLFGLKTKNEIAENLGLNQIYYGDYRHFFTDIDRYNQVTAEDIQKVAQKYFMKEKQNVVYIKN
ncbi:MAG TPA: pitrilysin family protein [Bdellovibrionota bacterium]|nr:pitrilysin family protein [Bdellovibrionota bacterium]